MVQPRVGGDNGTRRSRENVKHRQNTDQSYQLTDGDWVRVQQIPTVQRGTKFDCLRGVRNSVTSNRIAECPMEVPYDGLKKPARTIDGVSESRWLSCGCCE